jgi:hypothetical protein
MLHSRSIHRFSVWVTIVSLVVGPGCSRKFWREQADRDTYEAIAEKQTDERWLLPDVNIVPDARSRFYDPYDPDCKPLPPDDPAASEYMRCANGMRGYKSWHKFGETFTMENPQWLDAFGISLDETGQVDPAQAHSSVELSSITLQEAIELSYIHSRDYQSEIEDLYLSALDLTFQRFQFGVRYLEPTTGISSTLSSNVTGAPPFPRSGRASTTYSTGTSNLGLTQLLPAGGQWALEIANSTMWIFGTNNQTRGSASDIAFSLVQPLLFGAGRHVAMEGLTQAERNVLYTTRDLARFRRSFFADTASSFLQILQQRQVVSNQLSNIDRLQTQIEIQRVRDGRKPFQTSAALRRLPDDFEIPESLEGRVVYDDDDGFLFWRDQSITDAESDALLAISDDPEYQRAAALIVEFAGEGNDPTSQSALQLLTNLSNAENTLRAQERVLQDLQDAFKTQLGLPPDINLEIDTSLLEPFELIDPDLSEVEASLTDTLQIVDRPLDAPADFDAVVRLIRELDRLAGEVEDKGLDDVLAEFDPVEGLIESGRSGISGQREFTSEEEIDRVRKDLRRDKRLYRVAQSEFEAAVRDLETLKAIVEGGSAEVAFQKLDGNGDGIIQLDELSDVFDKSLRTRLDIDENEEASIEELTEVVESIAREIREPMLFATQSLEVVQAGLRTELIGVNKFKLPNGTETPTIQEAVRVGLENRLDLMNAKAEVMDARRQLEIAANALEGGLDVQIEGSHTAGPGAPRRLNFRRDQLQLDVGLQLTTPLDQIDERNTYAEALVSYQRARRDYMAFEDTVKTQIRSSWRQLEVSEQQLEIDRRTIRQAAVQYDSAAQNASRGNQANAFDLLQALGSLLQAQNSLIGDWVTYEVNRLDIYRDMGIMEVDSLGIWQDNFYQQGQSPSPDPGFNSSEPPTDAPFIPDEEPSDEPTFPLDSIPEAPPVRGPEIAPAPPQAQRRFRGLDFARFRNIGRRSSTGDTVVAR